MWAYSSWPTLSAAWVTCASRRQWSSTTTRLDCGNARDVFEHGQIVHCCAYGCDGPKSCRKAATILASVSRSRAENGSSRTSSPGACGPDAALGGVDHLGHPKATVDEAQIEL